MEIIPHIAYSPPRTALTLVSAFVFAYLHLHAQSCTCARTPYGRRTARPAVSSCIWHSMCENLLSSGYFTWLKLCFHSLVWWISLSFLLMTYYLFRCQCIFTFTGSVSLIREVASVVFWKERFNNDNRKCTRLPRFNNHWGAEMKPLEDNGEVKRPYEGELSPHPKPLGSSD